MKPATKPAYYVHPDGEAVDFIIPTGPLTSDLALTVSAEDVRTLYATMRAIQLGADTRGDL